jgi:hypothetical protein
LRQALSGFDAQQVLWAALYLNVFVAVVQAFQKLSLLQPLAPTNPSRLSLPLRLSYWRSLLHLASGRNVFS